MRLRLPSLFLLLWLSAPLAWATPDTTLTIDPSATAGTTITASDENNRNNDISTWANSHDHNDIDQTANTLNVGDGTAGNKTICANAADATDACVRFDDTANLWVVNNPDTTAYNQIVTQSGTSGLTAGRLLLSDGTSSITTITPGTSSATRTAGDVTLTNSLADITSLSITVTTSTNPVLLGFTAAVRDADAGDTHGEFQFQVDGSSQNGTLGQQCGLIAGTPGPNMNCSFTTQTTSLSAGSHIFKVQGRTDSAGGGTIQCDTGVPCSMWVREVVD